MRAKTINKNLKKILIPKSDKEIENQLSGWIEVNKFVKDFAKKNG